jgi:ribosomal protein L11 methyltransferase
LAKWPAVDVTHPGDPDLLLAMVDDFAPTAAEHRDETFRIFFASRAARDAGCVVLAAARYRAEAVDVDDEDWARRSQDTLVPVTVGRITIAPPWAAPGTRHSTRHAAPGTAPGTQHPAPGTIVILPSMGFGTGHHATTRLCVRALQAVDIADRAVLDVGTGSGVLAIAAAHLGAARAVGIDHDADAIQAANENLALNPEARTVEFRVGDLLTEDLPAADVVTANLTGALLVRSAALLLNLLRPAGMLIVSGLLDEERNDVFRAFAGRPEVGGTLPMTLVWEDTEDGWVALAMKRP